jgi:hypothetical protein
MSQNFQTLDPNARFTDLHCFAHDHPVIGPVPVMEEAKWEIREVGAAEEAEFEELTKLFVPFELDFD